MPDAPRQFDHVLEAAVALLSARQDQMVTVEEWAELARAVASRQGGVTADYLTERDLGDLATRVALDWDEATDGVLPDLDAD